MQDFCDLNRNDIEPCGPDVRYCRGLLANVYSSACMFRTAQFEAQREEKRPSVGRGGFEVDCDRAGR